MRVRGRSGFIRRKRGGEEWKALHILINSNGSIGVVSNICES